MGRVVATFGGVLVLALLAGAATEATVALGGNGRLANDTLLRPATSKVSPTPTATAATPTPAAKPAATATPSPTPTPSGPTATTNAFVHMRAAKSTSSAILIDLDGGTVVGLLSDSDAQWQQVSYNGVSGYIFKTYLTY